MQIQADLPGLGSVKRPVEVQGLLPGRRGRHGVDADPHRSARSSLDDRLLVGVGGVDVDVLGQQSVEGMGRVGQLVAAGLQPVCRLLAVHIPDRVRHHRHRGIDDRVRQS